MSESEGERKKVDRQLLAELRRQRAEIQERIEAAQRTVEATQEAIAKSRILLAQIDRQLERTSDTDELADSDE